MGKTVQRLPDRQTQAVQTGLNRKLKTENILVKVNKIYLGKWSVQNSSILPVRRVQTGEGNLNKE